MNTDKYNNKEKEISNFFYVSKPVNKSHKRGDFKVKWGKILAFLHPKCCVSKILYINKIYKIDQTKDTEPAPRPKK